MSRNNNVPPHAPYEPDPRLQNQQYTAQPNDAPTFAVEDDYSEPTQPPPQQHMPQHAPAHQGYGHPGQQPPDPYAALRPDDAPGSGYAMPQPGQPAGLQQPNTPPPQQGFGQRQPGQAAAWPNEPAPYPQQQPTPPAAPSPHDQLSGYAQNQPRQPYTPAQPPFGQSDFRQDYREYPPAPGTQPAAGGPLQQPNEPARSELSASLAGFSTPQGQQPFGAADQQPAPRQRIPSSFPQADYDGIGGSDPFASNAQPAEPAFGTPDAFASDAFGAPNDPRSAAQSSWGANEPGFGPDGGLGQDLHATQSTGDFGFGSPEMGQDQAFGDHADFEDFEPEEKPKRGWMRLAAVIAMFVVLGGGLTYAFQTFINGDQPKKLATAPMVKKGASGPIKVRPDDPGGKKFAHTDSKVMGRLGNRDASSSSSSSNFGGVRRVSTVSVGPDGTVRVPPAGAKPSEPAAADATISVPGLSVVGGGFGTPSFGGAPAKPTSAQPTSRTPKIITAGGSRDAGAAPTPPKTEPKKVALATPVKKPQVSQPKKAPVTAPKKPAASTAAARPKAPAAPTTSSGVSVSQNGYVAVLASVPASDTSRLRALQEYADIQQKYTSILGNKRPDVREANLGARGVYHRLLVGPPGSRSAASKLCQDLKAEGYPSCWVTAY